MTAGPITEAPEPVAYTDDDRPIYTSAEGLDPVDIGTDRVIVDPDYLDEGAEADSPRTSWAHVDMAEARYRLAYAHFRAGNNDAARYQVLRALEIAPNYYEALELLLELRGQTTSS